MNKKLAVVLVILILLILGGGALVMKNKSVPTPVTTTPAAVTPTKATAAEAQGTLKGLLTSGEAQTCTFTSQKQASTSGTVYVSGGKMRGDFTTTNQGQTLNGHMIIDSGFSYIWTDLMTRGMKIALTEGQATGSATSQGMDVNQTVSYTCKPWTVDASKFILPTDITFTTVTVPGAAAPSGTGTVVSPCSACDSLPAAAQNPCKAQLNCK